MKYKSVFEIIGPIMLGPSSSHTAGAARIGQLTRRLFGKEPSSICVHLYGSFAQTYQGHGTDIAVIGGLLDLNPDDPGLPHSLITAKEKGIQVTFLQEEAVPPHPNTLKIVLSDATDTLEVTGISIGGGSVQIAEVAGFPLKLSGENPAILIFHTDAYGVVSSVTQHFANHRVNIGRMELSRITKGQDALMVLETDQDVSPELLETVSRQSHVKKVVALKV